MPSLVRFGAQELAQKVPSLEETWSKLFDRMTAFTEEEERQIREAEAAMEAAPAPTVRKGQSLPVV